MKILLVATAYNSLTQRVHVELDELGHEISVELALNEQSSRKPLLCFSQI
jgi:putative two-component system hydrogenase maturation factor HypX/HoxX